MNTSEWKQEPGWGQSWSSCPCQYRSHFRGWGPPMGLHQGELWGYSLVTESPVREGQPKVTQRKEKLNWGPFLSSRHCYRVRIHGFLSEMPRVHPPWQPLTWESQAMSHFHIIIYTTTSSADNLREPWTLVGREMVATGTVWQHNPLIGIHLAEMRRHPHKNWLTDVHRKKSWESSNCPSAYKPINKIC